MSRHDKRPYLAAGNPDRHGELITDTVRQIGSAVIVQQGRNRTLEFYNYNTYPHLTPVESFYTCHNGSPYHDVPRGYRDCESHNFRIMNKYVVNLMNGTTELRDKHGYLYVPRKLKPQWD